MGNNKRKNNWKPEYGETYRSKNLNQILYSSAKQRANKKGLPFDISRDDIIIPEYCPILGVKLEIKKGSQGGHSFSPSLDKIVPELGYIKGNIWVISLLANNMKSSANKEQLLKFADWIRKNVDV
jgi:hypothetical protein